MDIGILSTAMSQISVQSSVSLSLQKMSMDSCEDGIKTIASMLDDTAIDPSLGKIIDAIV